LRTRRDAKKKKETEDGHPLEDRTTFFCDLYHDTPRHTKTYARARLPKLDRKPKKKR
jgi:hypothetical protein